jgi:AbrB family looped-hinge helix DNA binding protein
MTATLQLGSRGTLTLPKKIREKFGLAGESIVSVEDTAEGILIRPAAVFPMEIYSEERIAEFDEQNNSAIANIFKNQPA